MPPKFSKEIKTLPVSGWVPRRQMRTSPCEAACPAGNRIQAMESLLKDGKKAEARAVLLSRNPFPGITGRVCPHPCEKNCNRARYDEAVAIRLLERAAAEDCAALSFRIPDSGGKKIAVIGSGPAGMSCACFLRLFGHDVTVFEAAPVVGGVPRVSIPDFRLPKQVPDRENGFILSLGVRAHTNTEVGRHISIQDLRKDFDACVVAVGNSAERRLAVKGGDAILAAVDFLGRCNMARPDFTGREVVILGGGGVAFDCGFTALRLGASRVRMVFPEAADAIRAPEEEVDQARRESIQLHPSRTAVAVEGDQVHTRGLKAFSFSPAGEMLAEYAEGEDLALRADIVISASGLVPSLSFLDELAPAKSPRGHLLVDEYGESSVPGVFAAGDIVTGPSTVAQALAQGRNTALGVHARLLGLPPRLAAELVPQEDGSLMLAVTGTVPEGSPHVVDYAEICNPDYHEHSRRHTSRAADASPLPFDECDKGLSEDDARGEAARCMHCGHCIDCGACVERCPNYILERDEDGPRVRYPEECWHCACCRTGCPTGSIMFEFPITMLV